MQKKVAKVLGHQCLLRVIDISPEGGHLQKGQFRGMASKTAVLLVTDLATLPSSAETWAMNTFEEQAAGGENLTVLTSVPQGEHMSFSFCFSSEVACSLKGQD